MMCKKTRKVGSGQVAKGSRCQTKKLHLMLEVIGHHWSIPNRERTYHLGKSFCCVEGIPEWEEIQGRQTRYKVVEIVQVINDEDLN